MLSLFFLAITTLAAAAFLLLAEKQLQGVVRDSISGKAINSAVLNIADYQVETDVYGQFSLTMPQKNSIPLQAQAPGYLPAAFSFDVPWYLKIGRIDVEMIPIGFSVQVVDAYSAETLPNVSVSLGDGVYVTDENGEIRLSKFEPLLPMPIIAEQSGYKPWRKMLTRLPQNSSELPVVIRLEPRIFSGTVIAADNADPLSAATIATPKGVFKTNDRGEVQIPYLAAGDELLISFDDRFESKSLTLNNEETMTIALEPRRLTVSVSDGVSGVQLSDVSVTLGDETVQTDENGIAQFSRVPISGTLFIGHTQYAAQNQTYMAQTEIAIKLRPNSLQGVVRDATTREPLANVQIIINGQAITLSKTGEYLLPDLNQPLNINLKAMGYNSGIINAEPSTAGIDVSVQNLQTETCQRDENTAALCVDILMSPFNARAIYIPFSLLSLPDTIYDLFDLVSRTELNAVIVDVKSDRGSLAWDSQTDIANALGVDGNRDGWMTLDTFIAEAKSRNIYTIARIVTFKDNPLAFGYPSLAVTHADGSIWIDGEGLAWANPFREEVWNYNIALAKEIAEIGFDEINMDYLRFPSDGDLSAIVYAEENTADTRTTAIRTFVSRMRNALNPYGVYLSADVFGLTVWVDPESDMNIGQRVKDIAPYVDYLSPMIYPSTFIPGNLGYDDPSAYPYQVIYRSQMAAMERVVAPTKVRPWLQAYWYSPYEMLLQKQAANDANSAGWLWWNAGGVYDESVFNP